MKIYAARVHDIEQEQENKLFTMLDRNRRDKVLRIKSTAERDRSIYAGLLLRYAFIAQNNTFEDWDSIEIVKSEYGKPGFANRDNFMYSLSHSGEWVICATDDKETGVDIQEMKPYRLEMARRFYHIKEYEQLCSIENENDRKKHFYSMWTAKEAYAKLTGRGIGAGVSRYMTQENYRWITDCEKSDRAFMRIYDTIPGYLICACSYEDDFPEKINIITQLW